MMTSITEKRSRTTSNLYQKFQELPLETQRKYTHCMMTEALYKSAIPCGILGAYLPYAVHSIFRWRKPHFTKVCFCGVVGFIYGKLKYTLVCLEKHAPECREIIRNMYLDNLKPDTGGNLTSFDESIEQDSTWNSATLFDNTGDEFSMQDDLGETVTNNKINRKRVTYSDLLKRHRSQYQDTQVSKSIKQKQDEEVLEDTTFESETEKEHIWA